MVDLANIPTSGRGILGSALQWVANLLPWGLGALGLTYVMSQSGGEDSFMSRLEGIPIIGTIVSAIGGLINRGTSAFRRLTNREGYEAEQGMVARVNGNQVFEQAAREVGGTADEQRAFAESLREVVRGQIRTDAGSMSAVNENESIQSAIAVRTAILNRMVEEQNRRNPTLPRDPNNPQRAPLQDIAERYAIAISGAENTEAAYINPNTAKGYLGLEFATTQGVSAQGQYQASQVGQFRVELAPAAPEGAPPTPASPASPGRQPAAPGS